MKLIFWTLAVSTALTVWLTVLFIIGSSLIACEPNSAPARQPLSVPTKVLEPPAYADSTDADSTDADSTSLDTGGRLATSGTLTFEYLNNETEIFRPSTYTVRLWRVDETAAPSYAYLSSLGVGTYDTPTYRVVKPDNRRSYTRKTVKTGWYLAEFDGSGKFFKINVTPGSDGLLVYNEHDFTSPFSGYFPTYGKIKVGWKTRPAQDATVVLHFFGQAQTNIWIYAEDGTGTARSQCWFMPAGTYTLDYNLHADDRYPTHEVTIGVQPGKTYPYVKLAL